MSTVFIVRSIREIAASPLWDEAVMIPEGELLLARRVAGYDRSGVERFWKIFPFPGIERDWHPFMNNRRDGLGVPDNFVHVLFPLTPPPRICERKDLSPSSWAAANHSACVWFLERHEAITTLLTGIAEAVSEGEGEGEEK